MKIYEMKDEDIAEQNVKLFERGYQIRRLDSGMIELYHTEEGKAIAIAKRKALWADFDRRMNLPNPTFLTHAGKYWWVLPSLIGVIISLFISLPQLY